MTEMFGLWSTSTETTSGDLAFSISGDPGIDDVPVWRVDLPADPTAAAHITDTVKAGLKQTEQAVYTAEPRIDALIQTQQSPLSFSTASFDEGIAGPEQELLGLLQEAQFGTQQLSFAVVGEPGVRWEDTVAQFQSFTTQVQRTLTHFAWVETSIGGRLLARTSVNWLGTLETFWQDHAAPEQMGIHRETLQIALSGRILMLRTLIVIAASAGKLSVLLTTPGGALLALPAAWKFINQIRAELERHQNLMEVDQNGK